MAISKSPSLSKSIKSSVDCPDGSNEGGNSIFDSVNIGATVSVNTVSLK